MCDDDICDLCKEVRETSDHIWYCSRLKEKRSELDAELAEVDPKEFTPAMRQGVACALNADPRRTYWGADCKDDWDEKKKWRYGCIKEGKLNDEVKRMVKKV